MQTNYLTRPIAKLTHYASACRFIDTGYPAICGHPVEGQIAQDVTPIVLRATIQRAGSFRWLRFEGTCPVCGRWYMQESDKRGEARHNDKLD